MSISGVDFCVRHRIDDGVLVEQLIVWFKRREIARWDKIVVFMVNPMCVEERNVLWG